MTALAPDRPSALIDRVVPDSIHFVVRPCALGLVLVAFEVAPDHPASPESAGGICAILLGDEADALQRELAERFPSASLVDGGGDLHALACAVATHVDDPRTPNDFPIVMRGTVLQQAVWRRLCEIPVGETVTYGAIAASLGLPAGARAVARACAANPLAVVVPCHRVVRGDGSLAGYRWGVARKRALLAKEGTALLAKEGTA